MNSRLHLFAGAALAVSCLNAPAMAAKMPVKVKIVAINDFHGNLESPGNFRANASAPNVASGGVDYLAGYIAQARQINPNIAVVSAGDLVGASPLVSALFHDEGTIETMNRLGLDFNAVGNHEFDAGREELLRKQNGGCYPHDANTCKGAQVGTPVPFEGAKFRFLAANVVDTASGKTLFPPYGIKTFNGVRVGFIGLTLKETPTIVTPAGVAGLEFKDEAQTINSLIPQLRARGVEAIVVLIHQGGAQDTGAPNPSLPDINGCAGLLDNTDGSGTPSPIKAIVGKLDDAVDLVISGHTHTAYNCAIPNAKGRPVPVSSANALGRVITDIDLTLDPVSGHVKELAVLNRVVDRTNTAVTPNATIQNIVSGYKALVTPIANQVIGAVTQDLPNTRDRACNMPAGELIADAQLKATQAVGFGEAQIAFMNPGGVRSPGFVYNQISGSEKPGEITYGEAFTVQPFGNSLVTLTLTAQQLKDVLEQQFPGCMDQAANRVLLPSAGFSYAWDASKPLCQKISDVKLVRNGAVTPIVDGNGQVIKPNATYRVTVNSFLATGGDGFKIFNLGTHRLGGAQDIDALLDYLKPFKSPNAPYDPNRPELAKPRIQRLDAGASCS